MSEKRQCPLCGSSVSVTDPGMDWKQAMDLVGVKRDADEIARITGANREMVLAWDRRVLVPTDAQADRLLLLAESIGREQHEH